jgi:hypothetical protein
MDFSERGIEKIAARLKQGERRQRIGTIRILASGPPRVKWAGRDGSQVRSQELRLRARPSI